MAVGLFRAILGPSIGPPWDPSINDWVFTLPDGFGTTDVGHLVTEMERFYNHLAAYICTSYQGTAQVEVYDITTHLNGSAHGSPVSLNTMILTPSTGAATLPANVSVSLDYRSPYGGAVEFGTHARPRSRHRGRIFLGPLTTGAVLNTSPPNPSLVSPTFAAAIVGGASTLQANVNALIPGVTDWVQWSRVDSTTRHITDVSVRTTFTTSKRREDLGVSQASASGL